MNKPAGIPQIAFIDLLAQRRRLGDKIDAAVLRVVNHGGYVMGPEVKQIEADLAAFCGAREVISCSNGTDALTLVLRAKGVGPGDAVLCPSFTFAATAEVVALAGATPVFVDIDADTFNMSHASLKAGVDEARRAGLNPVAVVPVDLFGLPADYDALLPLAEALGLWVLSDAAQSFGAEYKGRKVGTFGVATTTSFFPAKPLGCYGDGGAIFTDDSELAAVIRSLRVHGQGSDKYDNVRIGINGRLDTIQAAVLIEKLKIFPDEIAARDRVARRYNDGLREVAGVPETPAGSVSTWAQYTLRVKNRDAVAANLKERGVPTAVYYPKPLHQQTAYRDFPVAGNGLPVSEALAAEVISLPMHPYLEAEVQDWIIGAVVDAVDAARAA
jgi:dTDP-4-amino-4,6-dideoxygalactose transaminase